ncbi:MAG: hypothetical protein IJM91_00495 [Lachnospiraceae bacterium]|nr:hypothetical protein [Lachnospiraceae bacterium]
MIYLFLAIISSVSISVILRVFDKKIENNMILFAGNYVVCTVFSAIFGLSENVFTPIEGTTTAAIIGLISGVFYLMGFVLLQVNIRRNGIMLAGLFMRLGVLVPLLMAIVFFKERPQVVEIIGIITAIAAIFVINLEKKADGDSSVENTEVTAGPKSKAIYLLLLLLITGGLTDSFANIHDKMGNRACSDQYLLITFSVALLSSIVMAFVKKQSFRLTDFTIGMFVGFPNYFCSRFLLLSLSKLKAIVVYPVYNIATILLISLCGIIVFREKLTRNRLIGIIMVLAALVLLNIKI